MHEDLSIAQKEANSSKSGSRCRTPGQCGVGLESVENVEIQVKECGRKVLLTFHVDLTTFLRDSQRLVST